MENIPNKKDKVFFEELSTDFIIKKENDIIESIPSSNINLRNNIKELIDLLKDKINTYEKKIVKLLNDKINLKMKLEMIIQKLPNNNSSITLFSSENINNEQNPLSLNNINKIIFNKNIKEDKNKIKISSLDVEKLLIEENKELKKKINEYKNKTNKEDCKFCKEKEIELRKKCKEKMELILEIIELKNNIKKLKLSKKVKKREKIENSATFPNILKYFIYNNKYKLVDSNKNLWHLTKCLKFQEFKEKYIESNSSFDQDDILEKYLDKLKENEIDLNETKDEILLNLSYIID